MFGAFRLRNAGLTKKGLYALAAIHFILQPFH